jgi:hypothetical protein
MIFYCPIALNTQNTTGEIETKSKLQRVRSGLPYLVISHQVAKKSMKQK